MKFSKFFVLNALAFFALVTACKKEESTPPVLEAPKIQVISADIKDKLPGDFVQIVAVVTADADLTRIDVTRSSGSSSSSLAPFPRTQGFRTKTSDTLRINYTIVEPENTTVRIIIKATDKDNRESTETISIIMGAPVAVYPAIAVMGAQSATAGSFLQTDQGTRVYTISQAAQTSATVDMVYLWGANNGNATFAAPSSNLTDVFPATNRPSTWSVRNATTFKITNLTASEYASIQSDVLMKELAETGMTANFVDKLEVDKVFVFKLDTRRGSKIGLAKVKEIRSTGPAGEIVLEMKIQN